MKSLIKHSLLFCLLSFSLSECQEPAATHRPTLSFLSRLVELDEQAWQRILEDFDFDSSRGIDISLPIRIGAYQATDQHSPLILNYKARWGHKGAGDEMQPFHGFSGALSLTIAYDGLTIDPFKARSIWQNIEQYAQPFLHVSPLNEFYLKLYTLLWSEAQKTHHDIATVTEQLRILFERLKKTPGSEHATVPFFGNILDTRTRHGIATLFTTAPEKATKNLILLSKQMLSVAGMLRTNKVQHQQEVQHILAQINYFGDETVSITLPSDTTLTFPFGYVGSGNINQPFSGLLVTVDFKVVKWLAHLPPDKECVARIMLLFLHNAKSPLPSYKLSEELSTLLTRLSITPLPPYRATALRDLLNVLCEYHQHIINHNFALLPTHPLSNTELFSYLMAVFYKAYTLHADYKANPATGARSEEITAFLSDHCAYAIRSSQGFMALKDTFARSSSLYRFGTQDGITLDLSRFLRTLLQENEPVALPHEVQPEKS